MKIKNIYEPIFNTHLLLIYDCTALEAENYLNEKNIQTQLRGCSGQTGSYNIPKKNKGTQERYYIWVEKDKPDKQLSVLLHEISHLVFFSLGGCLIKITPQTDEIFAYYFDWWFGKIWPLFKRGINTKFN